jgi:hypothetical protein
MRHRWRFAGALTYNLVEALTESDTPLSLRAARSDLRKAETRALRTDSAILEAARRVSTTFLSPLE